MPSVWLNFSALPSISSNSSQEALSWGEHRQNCSTWQQRRRRQQPGISREIPTTYLLELVHTEDASGVSSMGANLLTEARGDATILDGEILGGNPLVTVKGSNGLLRGSNQVLLLKASLICFLTPFANHLQKRTTTLAWFTSQQTLALEHS